MSVWIGKTGTVRLTGREMTALRNEVLERDCYQCQMCRRCVTDAVPPWSATKAHLAHIIGRGAGGQDTAENCRILCGKCHLVDEHNPKSVPPKR